MWCSRLAAAVIVAVFGSTPALAWWDEGHMQIAFLAYKRLGAPIKDKVDALLSLNKDYPKWTAGAPDEKTAKLYAFIHAATWADDIKRKGYGYRRDNVDTQQPAKTLDMLTTISMLIGITRTLTSHRVAFLAWAAWPGLVQAAKALVTLGSMRELGLQQLGRLAELGPRGMAMNQQKEKTDERERWERDCLAKAAYCAWSASMTPDKFYRDYLSALAVDWKRATKAQPDQ